MRRRLCQWAGTCRSRRLCLSWTYRFVCLGSHRLRKGDTLTVIACDGETKAEIVIPLRILSLPEPVGVLDLDSTILGTFDDDDLAGLLLIVDILGEICEWA